MKIDEYTGPAYFKNNKEFPAFNSSEPRQYLLKKSFVMACYLIYRQCLVELADGDTEIPSNIRVEVGDLEETYGIRVKLIMEGLLDGGSNEPVSDGDTTSKKFAQ